MTTSYSSYMAPVYSGAYEAGLMTVGDLDTVESYCRYFNWLKPPFELERSSNYHLFKSGIESMWEDEANVNGGKWVLTMKNNPTLLGQLPTRSAAPSSASAPKLTTFSSGHARSRRSAASGASLSKLLDVSEADGIGLEFQVSAPPFRTPYKHTDPTMCLVQYGRSPASE